MIKITQIIDKSAIKESLTQDQIKQVVEALGGNITDTPTGFTCDTICHNLPGHSHNKKLYFYSNSKLFKCYTECDSAFDVFELVMKSKSLQDHIEMDFPQAIEFVIEMLKLEFVSFVEKQDRNEEMDILKKQTSLFTHKPELQIIYNVYTDDILKNLLFVIPQPWLKEGITQETMIRYGIKYYGTDHKIVIPHYNLFGELIGIRGRALSDFDVQNYGKYMPLRVNGKMYTHPLSKNLYGLNHNLFNITNMKKIIIFEAEKSTLLYDSLFDATNNISVAVCGSSISLHQVELIKQYCLVDEVIFAFDKQYETVDDAQFLRYKKGILNNARKFGEDLTISIMFDRSDLLGYKDSPIDKGRETFEFLYKNRTVLR